MNSPVVNSVWNGVQALLNTKVFNKTGQVKITQEEWTSTYMAVSKCCTNQINKQELYARVRTYLTSYLSRSSKAFSSIGRQGLNASEIAQITGIWEKYHNGIETLNHLLGPLNKTLATRASSLIKISTKICKGDTIENTHTIYNLGISLWTSKFLPRVEPLVYRFIIDNINTHFRSIKSPKGGETELEEIKLRISGAIALYGLTKGNSSKDDSVDIFYDSFYVKKYLADLDDFYSARAEEALSESKTFIDYVHKVNMYESIEKDVVSKNFLRPEWEGEVESCLYQAFVNDNLDFLIKEFRASLDEGKLEDISMCLRIIADNTVVSQNTLRMLYETYDNHLQEKGLALIKALGESADSQPFIETITSFYMRNEEVIKKSLSLFENKFSAVRDKAFTAFVNKNELCPTGSTKAAEFLARYIDVTIRNMASSSGSKTKNAKKGTPATATGASSSSSTEDKAIAQKKLFASVEMLKFIDDKDAFLLLYKRAISKRLIQGASSSIELEVSIEKRMEEICGTNYSLCIKNIIKDYEERNKYSVAFCNSEEWRSLGSKIVPQLTLITSSYWGLPHEPTDFRPPAEILAMEEAFRSFYTKENKFRRITWDYQFAKGELSTNYLPTSYTITCPAYQLGVLTFFNKYAEGGTMEKIRDETTLTTQILECSLFPLTQLRILTHDEKTGMYTLNKGFVGKKSKIALFLVSPSRKQGNGSIAVASASATDEGKSNNVGGGGKAKAVAAQTTGTGGGGGGGAGKEDLELMLKKQRNLSTQAAVIRVIKREKVLPYDELFNRTIKELAIHFKLSQQVFERALDVLIDQEFLELKKDATSGKKMYVYK